MFPCWYVPVNLHLHNYRCITNTQVVSMRSGSSFRYTDHWVGLKRGSDSTCACLGLDQACYDCRETWLWRDGSQIRYRYAGWRSTFSSTEPGGGACGRLSALGWADARCDYRLKFICKDELGKLQVFLLL